MKCKDKYFVFDATEGKKTMTGQNSKLIGVTAGTMFA